MPWFRQEIKTNQKVKSVAKCEILLGLVADYVKYEYYEEEK